MDAITHLFVYSVFFSLFRISYVFTQHTITPTQSIRDSGTSLVSAGGLFQLGFFTLDNSNRRYVGIWYTVSSETVVWVANREAPLSDHSGVLKVTDDGILVLLNSTSGVVWSSNTSRTVENPVAQLLDTGNLVVKDRNDDDPEKFLWQSFDYPCDTLLPEMKLGWNFVTGLERFLSSWKSTDDPAQGAFSMRLDPRGLPQLVKIEGDSIKTRIGSWNGLRFTGYPQFRPNPVFEAEFVLNENEVYYKSKLLNTSVFSRYLAIPSGVCQRFTWIGRTHTWELFSTSQADQCENYDLCGVYATCNINTSPVCSCLEGFFPKSQKYWDSADWSDGCVRRTPLECNGGDGFLKRTGVKLPDTSSSWYNKSMSLKECEGMCLKNCNCTAYSSLDVRGRGSGCVLWFGSLIDIREYSEGGQDLYIRMATSELEYLEKKRRSGEKKLVAIIVSSALLFMGMIIVALVSYIWKKKLKTQGTTKISHGKEDMELPMFDLATIANATDNFSDNKKLGEGGFGPVYKGKLPDERDIAVKRLSKNSKQGLNELKNEVILIAKLQHRNLVKLLGCCIQENENMLIYEYMPNKSLDFFIFDQAKSKLLDWHKRINIIRGVAKGLLYLHEDSRLRIIHRDLKTSNILLDDNMNPKISDFGLAKSFGEIKLIPRPIGLLEHSNGYMSPEYAVHGQYSIKSDVFSFGVLVLEILSGKKNRRFCHPNHRLNLLGHAWKLWIEDKPMELIDELAIGNSCTLSSVLRHIHVGLLCVQQRPEDRPNMSSVVQMLTSESLLPKPKQPGFFTDSPIADFSGKHGTCSTNEISNTVFEAR